MDTLNAGNLLEINLMQDMALIIPFRLKEMKFNDILKSISKLYLGGKLDECWFNVQFLLSAVTNDVEIDFSSEAYEDFYDELLSIVKEESTQFPTCLFERSHLKLLTLVLKCIRNSFYKSPMRQNNIASNEYKIKPLLELLDAILICYSTWDSRNNEPLKQDSQLELQSLDEAATASITCFVNMMAGQSSARKILWPYFKHKFRKLFSLPTLDVKCMSAALLHQFLFEDEFLQDILTEYESIIPILLNIYTNEGQESCFAFYCLSKFLSSSDIATSSWEDCSEIQRLLLLDIFASFIDENSEFQMRPLTLEFFQMTYKKNADVILNGKDKIITNLNPVVVNRLLGLLCTAAASSSYQQMMQTDKSLLISTLYLLKCLTHISGFGEGHLTTSEGHFVLPQNGFKRDLIRLLAGLVYKNKANQDLVGELDGVSLLLENSQHDDNNPLIRETCIFALRNLLEGNKDNQKIISELELLSVAPNNTLEKLGLMATVQEGKITLNQVP